MMQEGSSSFCCPLAFLILKNNTTSRPDMKSKTIFSFYNQCSHTTAQTFSGSINEKVCVAQEVFSFRVKL